MSKARLGIIGAGGFGREVARYASEINEKLEFWRDIVFLDDGMERGTMVDGFPVVGTVEEVSAVEGIEVVCAIGNPAVKYKVIQRALLQDLTFTNIIHPTAYLGDVELGTGIIIGPYSVLTTNIVLGNHVAINPQCGIGHDVVIDDYSSLYWNVNISGNVTVGSGSELGTKVTIIQGLTIGQWAKIGAGAVVTCDLPSHCTAVGVPAKVIKMANEMANEGQ